MISEELLDELQRLDSRDKLKVIEFLAGELAMEKDAFFSDGTVYDFWSPIDAPEAAKLLHKLLDE